MIKKSELIWNAIASVSASLLSMALLFIVTRVNGVDTAGMFSIVFATATVLNAIADFGMRVYQVTDSSRQHSFGIYLSSRIIVNIIMILCGILFVLISGYDREKAFVCLGLVAFRFVDGLSETYQGEFQLNGRLDIAGKSVFFRMLFSILTFAVVNILTKNIVAATLAMFLANMLIWLLYDVRLIEAYTKRQAAFCKKEIGLVIKDCFPLFLSTFLNNYIINAPKYAIDRLLTYDMQTYFNIIYMPTFIINLMSIFVLKPLLRSLGELWNDKKRKAFIAVVSRMILAICILTAFVEAVCYVIGIPLLNFIYNVKLKAYKTDLMILVVAGGLSALSVVLFYALTTMRAQKLSMVAYVAAALCGLALPGVLVREYAVRGAAISSVVIMLLQTGILFIMLLMAWSRKEKGEQEKPKEE